MVIGGVVLSRGTQSKEKSFDQVSIPPETPYPAMTVLDAEEEKAFETIFQDSITVLDHRSTESTTDIFIALETGDASEC